jgi:hypothetical protein
LIIKSYTGIFYFSGERMKKENLAILLASVVLLSIAIIPVAQAERGITDNEIRS